MIAVGYMDPGNWATDIEAGSGYGYQLLWIVMLSSLMAMLLQHLCIRMAIKNKMDLAQMTRIKVKNPAFRAILYLLAEIAIIGCDLAEVIGTAIALELLFGLPIKWGIFITIIDVLLLLQSTQHKYLEWFVMIMMSVIGACFIGELFIVQPDWWKVLTQGLFPVKPSLLWTDSHYLLAALGIIGATIMPHNLYLHSNIVIPKEEKLIESEEREGRKGMKIQDKEEMNEIKEEMKKTEREKREREQIKWLTIDSSVALVLALGINSAILIVAAAAFHQRNINTVQHIQQAALLLQEWLGLPAKILFAVALLAAGQSSTVAGTLAGQIVFEGFLTMKISPWLRRILTRSVAIVPTLFIIWLTGEESVNQLLIWSQVILSFQLPFAIVPLIMFQEAPINKWVKMTAWLIAIMIMVFNLLFTFTILIK